MSLTFDRTSLLACCLLLLVASACACNPSDASPPAPAPATPGAPALATQPTPAPVNGLDLLAPSAQQLPVAEDFEAEAEAAITAKSYKQDLGALSREIEQDTAAQK